MFGLSAIGNVLLNAGISSGIGYLAGGKKGAIVGAGAGGIMSGLGMGADFFGANAENASIASMHSKPVDQASTFGTSLNIGGSAEGKGLFSNMLSTGVQEGAKEGVKTAGGLTGSQFLMGKTIEAGVGLYGQEQQQKILEGQLELQRRQQAIYEAEAETARQGKEILGGYMSDPKKKKQTKNTTYSGIGLTSLYN